MKLSKKNAAIVRKTLDGWAKESVIPAEEHQRLLANIDVQPFDWRRLAGYAFLAALASLVIAIGSLMADTFLLAWISQFFRFDPPVRVAVTAILAAAFYGWGFHRRRQDASKIYSNEAVLFLGVIFTAAAIGQLGEWLDNGSGRISVLLLLGTLIYAAVGWFGRAPLSGYLPCCHWGMRLVQKLATCLVGALTGWE